MNWFHRSHSPKPPKEPALPEWAPSAQQSYDHGKLSDAPENEFRDAEVFTQTYPLEQPGFLPSSALEELKYLGPKMWTMMYPPITRFSGTITRLGTQGGGPSTGPNPSGVTRVETYGNCGDVCLLSNFPIIGGTYNTQALYGVYYEVKIIDMKGTIAIGTACRPYPQWRYPGWNRLSAGLHLDDMRKFFEDPDGGQDYPQAPSKVFSGDIIGCGYQFSTGEIFFTYNGGRLPPAFHGLYFPRDKQDVYAAIGVGEQNVFEVNFGGDIFAWKPGNNAEWRVSEQFSRLNAGGTNDIGDELPAYSRMA